MNKTRIFLIRHAETEGNIEKRLTGRQDYPLTQKGKESTLLLKKKLENVKFDVAYASTSDRTEKTILPLAEYNKIEIERLPELCEMYFGIYDGWKWEEVNKINPAIKETQNRINLIEGIENQETMEHVAERMYCCITEICKKNQGKSILMCSHGVAIEAFLRKIVGIPFCDEREKFGQHNAAINELEYEKGKFHILRLAEQILDKNEEEVLDR